MLSAISTSTIVGIVIDVVLVLLLVVFFVIGLKKGFVKMCKGFVASVCVLVIAGFAAAPITKLVVNNTKWDESLATKITTPMADKLPNAYAKLYYYDLDENPDTADELVFEIPVDNDGDGVNESAKIDSYDNIFAGTIYGTLGLHKIAKNLISNTITEDVPTTFFIDSLGQSIVYVIFLVIAFILVAIVARIIISVFFFLLKKVVSNLYIMHFLDKALGGVFGLASGALAILCVLTVFQLMSGLNFMSSVNTAFEHTYIAKFVMNYNFVYTFISKNVNITKLLGL